jgi:hypothetical protein
MLEWLDAYQNIGGDLVAAAGTIAAAILGAFTGVLTWVLTGLRENRSARRERDLQLRAERDERRQALKDQEDQKQSRIDDIVRALHAEILTGIVLYGRQTNEEEVRRVLADPRPFATPDETDFIFASIKDEIAILPSEVIHSVVAYYRVAQQTNLIIRDFRDMAFLRQPAEHKQRYLSGYIALVQVLKHRGELAVAKLSEYGGTRGFGGLLDAARSEIEETTELAMTHAGRMIGEARKASGLAGRGSDGRKNGTAHRK